MSKQNGNFTKALCARRSYLKVNRLCLTHFFISKFDYLEGEVLSALFHKVAQSRKWQNRHSSILTVLVELVLSSCFSRLIICKFSGYSNRLLSLRTLTMRTLSFPFKIGMKRNLAFLLNNSLFWKSTGSHFAKQKQSSGLPQVKVSFHIFHLKISHY